MNALNTDPSRVLGSDQRGARVVFTDGGRAAAGFKGGARDCVARAVAIAAQLPYEQVYRDLNALTAAARRAGSNTSARTGIPKAVTRKYMQQLGATWTPTMAIGSGCKVHLCATELPLGRLVVLTSRHLVAVIDGVVHDAYDSTRGGRRCVYGYWTLPSKGTS